MLAQDVWPWSGCRPTSTLSLDAAGSHLREVTALLLVAFG